MKGNNFYTHIIDCIIWRGRLTTDINTVIKNGELYGVKAEVDFKADFIKKGLSAKVKYCNPVGCKVFQKDFVLWQ